MESAKRASVVIIVWNLNFSFFLKRGEARGKRLRKMLPPPKTTKSAISRKKSKEFFIFHSHETDDPFTTHTLRFQTHTHTCLKRVNNNNNNAGVHNLFPVV